MAIVFRCECGKQMRAPEKFTGRRLKCKACGKAVQIPVGNGNGNGTSPHATPSSPPPMPQPVAPEPPAAKPTMTMPVDFVNDDATISDEPAARREPSPQNSDDVTYVESSFIQDESGVGDDETVKMAAAVDEDETPVARPISAKSPPLTSQDTLIGQTFTEWADGREQEPDLPRGGRWFTVFVVLLLFAGVAGAAFYYWDDLSPYDKTVPATLSDLDLVPFDAVAVATIQLQDVWNHVGEEKAQSYQTRVNNWFADLFRVPRDSIALLDPSKIERITLAKLSTIGINGERRRDGADWWLFVKSSNYDRAKLISRLEKISKLTMAHDEMFYLRRIGGPGSDPCVYFVNENIICIASQNGIEEFVSRPLARRKSRPLDEALKLAEKKTAVAALKVRHPWTWTPIQNFVHSYFRLRPEENRRLEDLHSATVTMDLATTVKIEAKFRFVERSGYVMGADILMDSILQPGTRQMLGMWAQVDIAKDSSTTQAWQALIRDYDQTSIQSDHASVHISGETTWDRMLLPMRMFTKSRQKIDR